MLDRYFALATRDRRGTTLAMVLLVVAAFTSLVLLMAVPTFLA